MSCWRCKDALRCSKEVERGENWKMPRKASAEKEQSEGFAGLVNIGLGPLVTGL